MATYRWVGRGQQFAAGMDAWSVSLEPEIGSLGGVEILGHQRRRHHEGLPGVGEALAGGAVHRKLPGRVERGQASEITDGERVFGVREPAQNHPAGIARLLGRFGRQRFLHESEPTTMPVMASAQYLWHQ